MGRDCCIRGKLLGLRLVTRVQPETGEAGLICGREHSEVCGRRRRSVVVAAAKVGMK